LGASAATCGLRGKGAFSCQLLAFSFKAVVAVDVTVAAAWSFSSSPWELKAKS